MVTFRTDNGLECEALVVQGRTVVKSISINKTGHEGRAWIDNHVNVNWWPNIQPWTDEKGKEV